MKLTGWGATRRSTRVCSAKSSALARRRQHVSSCDRFYVCISGECAFGKVVYVRMNQRHPHSRHTPHRGSEKPTEREREQAHSHTQITVSGTQSLGYRVCYTRYLRRAISRIGWDARCLRDTILVLKHRAYGTPYGLTHGPDPRAPRRSPCTIILYINCGSHKRVA